MHLLKADKDLKLLMFDKRQLGFQRICSHPKEPNRMSIQVIAVMLEVPMTFKESCWGG